MKNSLLALTLIGLASTATAAQSHNRGKDDCTPEPAATCFPDNCCRQYCLGPENYGVNTAVGPKTCDGDFVAYVAGFYWNAHQDGMEYAIDNSVINPGPGPALVAIQQLNNIIDATYLTPNFKWDWGFKLGAGWVSACDGWDLGVVWTWYKGKANDHVEAEADDNHTLLPLWSAFAPAQGSVLYATDIDTHWQLKLNLVDIALGRQFWVSKYVTLRPHMGLRIAFIKQDFEINHRGGSWSERTSTILLQDAFNNEVDLDNDFKGVGIRAGLDSTWGFGCGWGLYGNLAASIVYGRFNVSHDEDNTLAIAPNTKTAILSSSESFRASRAMLDLGLGIQWSTMFCECNYGFTVALGWENHLFFHQNQLWRVMRIGDTELALPNNTGENVFAQSRGSLDTQGWTLSVKFEF